MTDTIAAQQKLFEVRQVSLTLNDRFLVPPFTVLDGRAGYWRKRKADWIGLGIKSELGREGKLLGYASITSDPKYGKQGSTITDQSTSVFDPVLCEIVYRWFCPEGGTVLDPFAGGSVRGIVAGALGRGYLGVDLRADQVASNVTQASWVTQAHPLDPMPGWAVGDSRQLPSIIGNHTFDAVLSCPPYYDLEEYSDDPRDLSTMDKHSFDQAYWEIIHHTVRAMKPDTFACWVVGEVRGPDGGYKGLIPKTIEAFEAAGARYYNEAVLLTSVGSAAIRVGAQFGGSRKLGKIHQQLLVFLKGDHKAAAAKVPVPEAAVEQGGAVWRADGTATVPDTGEEWKGE